jgi:hypothetical protein
MAMHGFGGKFRITKEIAATGFYESNKHSYIISHTREF